MNFTSTRNKNVEVPASLAIKQGISLDGGLFVPVKLDNITDDEIYNMCKMNYNERATFILSRVLDDYSENEINDCVNKAYTIEKFGSINPTPVIKLDKNTFMLELWHGPTCAFKDMALQILPHLLNLAIEKTNEKKTVLILVATSGDTGKAALEGFKDVKGTKIFVFYPQQGVSQIQKLQMITQDGKNVRVCGIDGNFDDAQNGVKAIFTDKSVINLLEKNGFIFSSANSINWGRLAPQIVYYFSSYCELVNSGQIKLGEKINFCVPTGNFGNILAAYYAKKMGLPVNKLICASNVNNVLTAFINDGIYDKNRNFYATISPSMDILISSNLERLLFDILNNDDKKLSLLMNDLKTKGFYKISSELHEKIKEIFYAGFCDDFATKKQINETYRNNGYISDTHTAVAIKVYNEYLEKTKDTTKTIIASTASPFKFSKAVLSAINERDYPVNVDEFLLINELSNILKIKAPDQLVSLKNAKVKYPNTCSKNDIKKEVLKMLKIM